MRRKQARALGLGLLVVGALLIGVYYIGTQVEWFVPWIDTVLTFGAGNETAGEWINIQLHITGGSDDRLFAAIALPGQSYTGYTVDDVYYAGQNIKLKVTVKVEYAHVSNIKLVDCYIRAVDSSDSTKNHVYDFADNVALSGSSPITWTSSEISKSFTQHFTDVYGSAGDHHTINYKVYCKVTATGELTGNSYTAELSETQFASHEYIKFMEKLGGGSSEVSPQITFASWATIGVLLPGVGLVLLGLAIIVSHYPKARKTVSKLVLRKRRRRRSR